MLVLEYFCLNGGYNAILEHFEDYSDVWAHLGRRLIITTVGTLQIHITRGDAFVAQHQCTKHQCKKAH